MSSSERIIRVIETVVSHQHTGIRFAGIVKETGIAKATVHRLLAELTDLGILSFSSESKRYRASLKLRLLGGRDHRQLRPPQPKQKLPENNGGYNALKFGKNHKKVYSDLSTDHPIDLT